MHRNITHFFHAVVLVAGLGGMAARAAVPVESLTPSGYGSAATVRSMDDSIRTQERTGNTNSVSQGETSGISSDAGDMVGNLLNRIGDLQQQVQEMKGELEVQKHAMKNLEEQSKQRYMDLDRRLSHLVNESLNKKEAPSPITSSSSEGGNAETLPAKSPDQAYQAAFILIGKQKFEQAIKAFDAFINNYPQSSYVANAWYWLGEIHSATGKPDEAMQAFMKVVNDYPYSSKTADAMYKLGLINAQQGNREKAKNYLKKVIKMYPDSSAATLSESYLQTMN